jgi:hypothetical protein
MCHVLLQQSFQGSSIIGTIWILRKFRPALIEASPEERRIFNPALIEALPREGKIE